MDSAKLEPPGADYKQGETRHHEVAPIDLDDPHQAALNDASATAEVPSLSTLIAIASLTISFIAPISCGYVLVTGILVPILTDLGGSADSVIWVVSGWSVASSVSFSIAGSLSDVFGRRWVILSGQAVIIVGSVVCATALNMDDLVAGSVLLGFGAGVIFVSYAGISELLPNKWRGIGLAATELAIAIPWGVGNVLLGSLFVLHTSLGWRWCYYIGLIFACLSLVGTFIFYFPPTRPQFDFERTRWDQIKSIDFVAFILYAGGLTSTLIGLSWGGQPAHPWRSASVIAPIVIGFLSLVACFIYDFTVPSAPLFPKVVFREIRSFTILLAVAFVAGMICYSMMALLPQGSLYLFTNDQIEIGWMALPCGCVQAFFGVVGALVGKIKHLKMQIIVTLVIQTVFTAALAGAVGNKTAWMAIQALSTGPFVLVVLVCYVIAGLNMPLRYLGLVSGLIGTFRSMGGSVGNAVFSTILQSIVRRDLGPSIASAALKAGFSSDPDSLDALIPATINAIVGVPGAFAAVPGINTTVEAAATAAFRKVYQHAFSMVFYATIPFGVIAIILAFFIDDPSMYLTNHTAVHMQKKRVFRKHGGDKNGNAVAGGKV